MQYPLRDAAYRNRLASYGPNFPHCGVGKEELAEAGFRVSSPWTWPWTSIEPFSTKDAKTKSAAIIAEADSKVGAKVIRL